jgi:hypothetical protein
VVATLRIALSANIPAIAQGHHTEPFATSGRFAAVRYSDNRWAITDSESEDQIVVFCEENDEAQAIVMALNFTIARGARRTSAGR